MIRTCCNYCLVMGTLLFSLAHACAQQVEIRLPQSPVTSFRQTVTIGDVAELSNVSRPLTQRLSRVDLDEFSAGRTELKLTQEQIRYRLLLAGFQHTEFALTGVKQVVVRYADPATCREQLETAFREQICQQFRFDREMLEVQVELAPDAMDSWRRLNLSQPKFVVALPVELPLGEQKFDVTITDQQQPAQAFVVTAKISVYRDLVMARENISRGDVIDAAKIERVRRPIDTAKVQFVSFEQAIGKQAQTDIQQFSLVKSQFVRDLPSPAQTTRDWDVLRDASVEICIERGPLTVRLKDARAKQNGRVGDYIDFINPKTKQTIRARIVDAATAKIEL